MLKKIFQNIKKFYAYMLWLEKQKIEASVHSFSSGTLL